MARVAFYEKPGCGTNRKQKAMLLEAGHELVARDLLAEPWTAARLRLYFGDAPVDEWFNPNAPRVKSGEIRPQGCGADSALAAMVADPLLIRRPLIEAMGQKCSGFDREPVLTLLGAGKNPAAVQDCSRPAGPPCPAPDRTDAPV